MEREQLAGGTHFFFPSDLPIASLVFHQTPLYSKLKRGNNWREFKLLVSKNFFRDILTSFELISIIFCKKLNCQLKSVKNE